MDILVSFYLLSMKYKELIDAAVEHLRKYPGAGGGRGEGGAGWGDGGIGWWFEAGDEKRWKGGARWMYERLNELDGGFRRPFDAEINYAGYGRLKYGICLTGFFWSGWWLSTYEILYIPFSVLIFYLLEVQFLFLFPLLIDQAKRPVWTGIREVLRIGLIRCIMTVIPISIFMMTGLFIKGNRLRNWYIGCLAVLIWYNDEVRVRI
jgi:hypothetical protein